MTSDGKARYGTGNFAVSKTTQKAIELYWALFDQSNDENVGDSHQRVFRGKITAVYNSLGISQSHYSTIRQLFEEHGCVTYLSKGTKASPSVLVLHRPPLLVQSPARDLTPRPTFDRLHARLQVVEKDYRTRMEGGGNIWKALSNLEARLTKVELLLKEREKTGDI